MQHQSVYRFGDGEPVNALRIGDYAANRSVKRPLTSPSEKENNIRIKIVSSVPVANIFQETVNQITGNRTREYLTTILQGEEAYANAANGTILVATDEYVSSPRRKVYSGFKVEYSNVWLCIQHQFNVLTRVIVQIRTWFVVDLDNLDEVTEKTTTARAKHLEEYFNETGIHWIHYVGPHGRRSPIRHHMWTASQIGQKFAVSSVSSRW